MAEPNGYIEGSNGERIEIVDSAARESLKTKLPAPKKAKAGDYLRISAINEDGSMLVEAVSAPGVELPTEATFAHITLETAQTADGECGVIIHPEGTEDVPELTFYGMRGDEAVRLNNVADAIDDRSVPNLGQVKKLVEKNGNDSGQNATIGILGDSYSAYAGSIPTGYQASYGVNDYNGITSEEQMWYRILASRMGATVLRNSSYSGSTISNSGYNGANATASSFLTRAAADFGNAQDRKPSKLFVLGGINDDWAGTTVGEAKYSDWTEGDLKMVAPATCKLFHDLLANNPGTDIVFILNDIISDELKTVLRNICGHYGVRCIELADIAKESSHPTVEGMAQIAAQIWGAMNQGTTIDPTLTQSGAAADAKAVGDALAGKVAGIGITAIMAITQAKYDELAMLGQVDESTLYIIKPESEDGPDMTMIPVLRSDGTAYIDLGVAPIDGAWYEVCFRGIAVDQKGIFGNRYTNVRGSGGAIDATWMSGYYNGSQYAIFSDKAIDISRKRTFSVSSTALTLDGDIVTEITAGTNTIVNKMLLFATNNSNEKNGMYGTTPCTIDFFYLRIWSGENKLLHNYIPAQDSEGVACIYDTVDKAYLYNAAEAGAFEYREELEES